MPSSLSSRSHHKPIQASYGGSSILEPRQSSTVRFPETGIAHHDGSTHLGDPPLTPSKKKSTRIPLFGRSRKKSTHSDAAPPDARRRHESHGMTSSRPFQDDQSVPTRASLSQPSLTSSPPATIAVQPTLGSRIAAHFTLTPRRSIRKAKMSHPTEKDVASDSSTRLSSNTQRISISSARRYSGVKQTNESTYRPSTESMKLVQPTITVSRPPQDIYDLGEFDDLFTRPRAKPKPKPIEVSPLQLERKSSTPPPSSPEPDFASSDGGNRSSATSTPTLLTPTISSSHLSSIEGITTGSEPHVTGTDDIPHPTPHDISHDDISHGSLLYSPSKWSRSMHRKATRGVPRTYAGTDTEIYSAAEESDAMSIMSMPLSGAMSSVKRRSINSLLQDHSRSTALTMRSNKSRVSSLAPSQPPSIPLPATPNTSIGKTRQRAQTVASSIPPVSPTGAQTLLKRQTTTLTKLSPIPPTPPPKDSGLTFDHTVIEANRFSSTSNPDSSSSSSSSTPTLTAKTFPRFEPIEIDVEVASVDELREGLQKQTSQLKDMASYCLQMTEEKAQLEKKVALLEREIIRRDKEIKGYTWLLNNTRPAEGTQALRAVRKLDTPDLDRSDDSSVRSTRLPTPSPSTRLPLHRTGPEDSGAESYATSGAESLVDSGTSGTESLPPRRLQSMKKLMLVESFNKTRSQPGSLIKQQAEGRELEAVHDLSGSRLGRYSSRSSVYSNSSSGSSPVSSPTAMSFTAAGLTTISEAMHNSSLKDQRHKERKEQERKSTATKSSKPTSSSSTSRPTPSEAYANNLKKGRPPSIGQVLDSSNQNATVPPMMQESFGGRSRAILGIASFKT
ncbi:hypothetical protein VNI00_000399 [Paramarasmius palmivorus]|uniref:Uncharacterized protein n=1 Tax=Paramarasmius palmivorus TaxID=297713 RepID=A0AAW0EF11_9AGAR